MDHQGQPSATHSLLLGSSLSLEFPGGFLGGKDHVSQTVSLTRDVFSVVGGIIDAELDWRHSMYRVCSMYRVWIRTHLCKIEKSNSN